MDNHKKAKLEDSFASEFILEHSTPTSQKVEDDQFQKKTDKKLNTEILKLPEIEMGDSYTHDSDTFPLFSLPEVALDKVLSYYTFPLFSLPEIALDKVLSFLSYDQVAQMRVVCKR